MVDNNERLPLLGATGETPEPVTSSIKQPQENQQTSSDNLINFSTQNVDGRSYISCKVCGFQIDITDKTDTFVVKCLKCNEATPIKRAPAKKRYVRCSCNCLLICCETANRIVCPRANCKKIIDLPVKKRRIEDDLSGPRLQQQSHHPNSPPPSDTDLHAYVICASCSHRFIFNVLSNRLATCPQCRCTSSVGHGYANTRGFIFIVLFIVFVIIAISLSVKAKSDSSFLNISLALVLFIISIIFLARSLYYFSLKVSEISTTNFQSA